MKENIMKPNKSEHDPLKLNREKLDHAVEHVYLSERQPLTLEDVIGWVEDLEKRIDRMEKLLGEHGIEEPHPH
jgi:hypothetical protein